MQFEIDEKLRKQRIISDHIAQINKIETYLPTKI